MTNLLKKAKDGLIETETPPGVSRQTSEVKPVASTSGSVESAGNIKKDDQKSKGKFSGILIREFNSR